ncbi:MAG: tRNA lysidine(34) synthetase TilS [Verrucomicrobia bacterium]|nr:tRNA lysidine(34) synthetase TilS [Verrucomicrobiota bacterium]
MSEFIDRIEQGIVSRRLLLRSQRLLVAVSGGVDSMVLLHVLARMAPKHRWQLVVAHFNHQLRGRSSDADERLVRETARKLRLTFASGGADVKRAAREGGLSIEMAARRCRHDFFSREAKVRGIRRIVLAHHAEDQVELFFLRLLRGAGPQGLAGMKVLAPSPWDNAVKLVRPLLECSRDEIEAFASAEGVRFRNDASNASSEFLRNRVRHELLPLLRSQFQPALSKVVLRQMEILSAENDFMDSELNRLLSKPLASFDALPVALQRRVLQKQLEREGVAPEFEWIESLRSAAGKVISVSGDVSVFRDEFGRLLVRRSGTVPRSEAEVRLSLSRKSGQGTFAGLSWNWTRLLVKGGRLPKFATGTEWFDADRVGREVVLRHWRAGDRFQPIGMATSQKLQDLFTNLKVPRAERVQRVVATTAAGEIWWVEGLRIGELFKLHSSTRTRLRWSWQRRHSNCGVQ